MLVKDYSPSDVVGMLQDIGLGHLQESFKENGV
jgi:hypothetical protein